MVSSRWRWSWWNGNHSLAPGGGYGGGGGAGGFRASSGTTSVVPYTASPLTGNPVAAITVTATGYPITVGGGAIIRWPSPTW